MIKDMDDRQKALADYMSELSEEAFCAGWIMGLEYSLWDTVINGPCRFGQLDIGNEQIEHLRQLSNQCHGWIIFDDHTEETWVPLEEWERGFMILKEIQS